MVRMMEAGRMNDSAALLSNGNVRVKRTRHGLMAYNINDIYLGRSLDVYGEYSRGETDLFGQLIKPGNVVLDVGANIGAHTIFLSRAVGPDGLVIAIEPQRAAHQLLCANLALNELGNVRTIQAGAGRQAGRALLEMVDYGTQGNFGGIRLIEQGGEDIEIVTIDGLGLDRCHFIKIDVEGHEQSVIAGALQTIARFKPLLYVENDRLQQSANLIRQLRDIGYRLYWHLPPLYLADNFYGNPNNLWPGIVSIDMLGIPATAGVDIVGLKPVGELDDWPFKK
jgi:FkbM family methyltransferase